MLLLRVARGFKNVKVSIKYCSTSAARNVQQKEFVSEQEITAENWKQRCELATAYRAFEKYNMHEGVCNHLSALVPSVHTDEKVALLIPYGLYWADVTPKSLVGIDIKTLKVVEGNTEPEITAKSIHCGIYRNRDDVKSVMHTHSRYATILTVLQNPEIEPIHQNSCRFLHNVAYDQEYGDVANELENEEGDRLGKALGDKKVLVMGSHGIATVGKSVHEAFDYMYYFEKAAEVQVLAYQSGKPLLQMKDKAAESIYEVSESIVSEYSRAHLYGLMNHFKRTDPNFIK